MNIRDFLSPNDVTIDVVFANKQKLLRELSNKAASRTRLPPDTIMTGLSKREELGSTGVGDGLAIPHARFDQIDKPFGMLLRLQQPIEFESLDGKPVDIVFLLLIPESAKGEQLSALACVDRMIRRPAVTAVLRKALNTTEIFRVLTS